MNIFGFDIPNVFIVSVAVVVLFILFFVAWCRIAKKAGKPWGLILIPGYGNFLSYSIFGCAKLFFAELIFNVVMGLSFYLLFFLALTSESEAPVLLIILFAVFYFLIELYFRIKRSGKIAECFGKSIGYTLGLLLLYPLFVMILGLGNSKYHAIGSTYSSEGYIATGSWTCSCGSENPVIKGFCSGCGAHKNAL